MIPNLSVAKDPVAVAEEWSNSDIGDFCGQNVVQAYAKVCGRDWTYYIKRVNINIGRPPDSSSRQSVGEGASSTVASETDDSSIVHIDLGPSKTVSRLHAELFYDLGDSRWHVSVTGRNGVQLNNLTLKRGQQCHINSGDVLGIAGTQMMFITAEHKADIHPMFLDMIRDHANGVESSGRWNDQPHAHPEPSTPVVKSRSAQAQSAAQSYTNGQAHIAPAPPDHVRPTTPIKSPRKSAPATSGKKKSPKKSPTLGRGVNSQSDKEKEKEIDWSLDANKSIRPTQSYAIMIQKAIESTEEKTLTLSGIYEYIKQNYSYYRHQESWQVSHWPVPECEVKPNQTKTIQNSIRHNLSLSPLFEKIPRRTDEPGKGMKWRMVEGKAEEILAKSQKKPGKGGRKSSKTSSPAMQPPQADFTIRAYPPAANGALKDSPTSRTPPMSSYPSAAQESFTPSRGNQLAAQALPVLSDDPSPLPHRTLPSRALAAMGSSPTLTSGAWHYENNSLVTPAPRPHNLNAPLPQTARLPTSHMADSSPAPFWRYSGELGSTPARWAVDMSPIKTAGGTGMQSSSPPPPAANGNDQSPTRGRGSQLQMSLRRSPDVDDDEGGIDLAR